MLKVASNSSAHMRRVEYDLLWKTFIIKIQYGILFRANLIVLERILSLLVCQSFTVKGILVGESQLKKMKDLAHRMMNSCHGRLPQEPAHRKGGQEGCCLFFCFMVSLDEERDCERQMTKFGHVRFIPIYLGGTSSI